MKIKSRNLLTVILALLCAAAVFLGIGLILPKAEKVNANAASSVSTLGIKNPGYTCDPSITKVTPYDYSISFEDVGISKNLSSASGTFDIEVIIPADSSYTVKFKFEATGGIGSFVDNKAGGVVASLTVNGGSALMLSYSGSTQGIDGIQKASGEYEQTFTNPTASDKTETVTFTFDFKVTTKNVSAGFGVSLNFKGVEAIPPKLAKPATSDPMKLTYSESGCTLNFTYADSVLYNNVEVTVVGGDGNAVDASDFTLTDTLQGGGSIAATKAGTYTVIFSLTQDAINKGFEWKGGGTDNQKLTLTIEKAKPKTDPKIGEGPWYTNKTLDDIVLEPGENDTPGSYSWKEGQSITAGTKNYVWVFTPDDEDNYKSVEGKISIEVEALEITGIEVVFEPGETKFYTTSKKEDLKAKLTVRKIYADGSKVATTDYELDGDISKAGTAKIGVVYTAKENEIPKFEKFNGEFDVEINQPAPTLWERIVAFFTGTALGLPVWAWFLIGLAALILLIIIIVVACKRRKTKEEKEEIKARKEEERQRKLEEKQRLEEERRLQRERLEEERRLQREKLEAEREMARAKQEAELERIRAQAQAQAGLAGAGMASMAMAQQPQQQQIPPQPVDNTNNELLREMTRQMAELRADNKATQAQLQAMQNSQNLQQAMPQPMQYQQPMMPQYPQYPQYQQPMMPQYGSNDLAMARMEAQLNAMQAEQRARYDAEQRIELAAMRAESHVDRDSRHSVDLAAMREHINGHNYNRIPDYSQPAQPAYNQPNSMDMMGALVAATLRNMANGELAATQSVPELPQKTETAHAAKYPSDAVITTTTTVDTTKNKPIRREEQFDVDGFYDSFDGN
ncbi:MAG: hypothetical protein K2N22_01635 [Clostridia bacterium]|nr:hypothetical protein [Clostridia bacterium]